MTTIGVCEDDVQLRSVLVRAFAAHDFEVVAVATGAEALRAFTERRPDVIVLDLGLPDVDGRDVCLALKANGVQAPVLMLTAQDGVHHRISGFEAGADDYLGKPFALAELMARVRVLERRAVAQRPVAEGVALDPAGHAVVRGDAGCPGAAPAPRLRRRSPHRLRATNGPTHPRTPVRVGRPSSCPPSHSPAQGALR